MVACLCAAGVITVAAQSAPKTVALHSLNAYDILYVLAGGGENALALMRDDGVVLIDPLPFGWGKATLEAIETVADQPVTTIVNIRPDEEHLKANTEYPRATRIVAHHAVAERAKKMAAFAGANAKFLPNVVVQDTLTLLDGPDKLELHALGPGVTDTDLVAVFTEKATAYFGALYPSPVVPKIDGSRGGSPKGFLHALTRIRTDLKGVRRVVAGSEAPRSGEVGAQKAGAAMPMSMIPSWKEFEDYAARAAAAYAVVP